MKYQGFDFKSAKPILPKLATQKEIENIIKKLKDELGKECLANTIPGNKESVYK